MTSFAPAREKIETKLHEQMVAARARYDESGRDPIAMREYADALGVFLRFVLDGRVTKE